MTPSSPAMRRAASVTTEARSGSSPGAGASTSVQMPSVCTVSTTGQAAAWPDGLRATSTASSRTKSTFSSSSRPPSTGPGSPTRASQSASSSAEDTTLDALAVVAAARGLGDDRASRRSSPKAVTSAAVVARVHRGQAIPSPSRRSRMASLSWAKCSAARLGCTATPSSSRACRMSCGTCSWSKVTTSHEAAKARTASRSVWSPTGALGTTRAAAALSLSARIESWTPSSTAGPCIIRASWPPPTTPTTGKPPGARWAARWAGWLVGSLTTPQPTSAGGGSAQAAGSRRPARTGAVTCRSRRVGSSTGSPSTSVDVAAGRRGRGGGCAPQRRSTPC